MTSRERSPQASIRNIVNTPFEDDRDVADFLETSLDYLTTGATARRSSQTIRLTTGPTSSTWPFDPQIRTASQQPSQLTIAECQRLAVSTDQPLTSPHIRHPIKEGRVQSVKIEGGTEIAPTISYITLAGSPALAHVGLTPQRQHSLGGFRVQGKTTIGALKVLEDALAVQEQGAFAVMLEAVLAEVARLVTKKLDVPTSGVGAGNGCDGQALVLVDISGNFPPGRFLPKLLKKYGDVWGGL